MLGTFLAQGAGDLLGLILFAAIFIGSLVLRARAEARARQRALERSAGEPEPTGEGETAEPMPIPPQVRVFLERRGGGGAVLVEDVPVVGPVRPERPPETPPVRRRRRPAPGSGSRPGRKTGRKRARGVQHRQPGAVGEAAPTEGTLLEREVRTAAGDLRRALLADVGLGSLGLRKAVLLSEVLGPPRALRPYGEPAGATPPGL